MASVPPFERLPAELVQQILLLTCESRCCDVEALKADHSRRGIESLTYKRLLAPAQISSRSRAFALSYLPIWRSLAEYVLAASPLGKAENVRHLLRLCSRRCHDTLNKIDLSKYSFPTICIERFKDVTAIVLKSAESLKELRLAAVGGTQPGLCECHPAAPGDEPYWHPGYSLEERVSRSMSLPSPEKYAFRLLRHTTSLQRLTVNLNSILGLAGAMKSKSMDPNGIKARPSMLDIRVQTEHSVTPETDEFFAKLAEETRHLRYSIKSMPWLQGNTLLVPCVKAASASLVELYIHVSQGLLALADLFGQDLPLLERLCVSLNSDYRQRDSRQRRISQSERKLLPSLTSFEGPAFVLDFLEMPRLHTLVTRACYTKQDEAMLIEAFNDRLCNVKDLVLLCDTSNEHRNQEIGEASVVLRSLLQALRPSSDASPCPALQRLGIIGVWDCEPQWFSQVAFSAAIGAGRRFRASQFGNCPVVGMELVELDKKRSICSQDDSTIAQVTPLCQPLNTIEILDCLVDPVTWQLLQESQCKRIWCSPDPSDEDRRMRYTNEFARNHRKALAEEA